MRRIALGVTVFAIFLMQALAQEMDAKRGEATLDLGGGKVSVDYGRPNLKGRNVETMIKPGDEWRMGSNAATTLSTEVDLKFGDKEVAKGQYVLRAKLIEKGKWHLLIQKEDKTLVAEVPMEYQEASSSVDLMTIKLDKEGSRGKLTLQWGKFSISTSFQKA